MTALEDLDAILAAVAYRSTVYAHEILDPLNVMLVSVKVIMRLEACVSEINGDRLTHSREFLNTLLDLRNDLAKETT